MGHPTSSEEYFPVLIAPILPDSPPEREYLARYIIPELESLCRDRVVAFKDIGLRELRWRNSDEGLPYGHIMYRFLEEIKDHSPWFIGVVGSEYGYMPGIEELQREPELFRQYPAVHKAAACGCGAMEIQMLEGALNNSTMKGRLQFYIHEPNGHIRNGEKAPCCARLEKLKERILQSGAPVQIFHSKEELLKLTLEYFRRVIDEAFPSEDIKARLKRERSLHDAYAQGRLRGYQENPGAMQSVQAYLEGGGPPLVITGPSGSGKTSLLACGSSWCRTTSPDSFIITHYIGAPRAGTNHLAILRRIISEIYQRYEPEKKVPSDPARIVKEFPYALGYLTDTRLVLVIAGLERLDEQSRDLSWLPGYFHPNIRVIVSVNDEDMEEVLSERRWNVMALTGPSYDDTLNLLSRLFGGNNNRDDRKNGSVPHDAPPRLFDVTNGLGEGEHKNGTGESGDGNHLEYHEYLHADPTQRMMLALQQCENRYGREVVEDILPLLAASRRGLVWQEFASMVREQHANRQILFSLLSCLPPYMTPAINDPLAIHDSELLAAIRRHYSPMLPQAHRRIARYFMKQQSTTVRMVDELPWQLEQLKDWKGLKECISSPDAFERLFTEERRYDLVRYWRVLAEHEQGEPMQAYADAIERLRSEGASEARIARLQLDIGDFLTVVGKYREALAMLKQAEEYFSRGEEPREAVQFLTQLGILHQTSGNYPEVDSAFSNAVRISGEKLQEDDPVAITAMEGMGGFLYIVHRYEESQCQFERARVLKERLYGADNYRLADTLNCLGAVCQARGNLTDATTFLKQALHITRTHFPEDHPDIARHLNNVGTLYLTTKVINEAGKVLEEALNINVKMLGPRHSETVGTMINLGLLHRAKGELDLARDNYYKALNAVESYFNAEHPFVAKTLMNIAILIRRMGQEEDACRCLRRALDIRIKCFGLNHPDTASAMLNLGSVLKQMKEYREAEMYYMAGIPLRIRFLGPDNEQTKNAIVAFVDLLEKMGCDNAEESVE